MYKVREKIYTISEHVNGPMKWMIPLGKIIMFSMLNKKWSIIYSHIQSYTVIYNHIQSYTVYRYFQYQKGVYLHSNRTIFFKLKIKLQTGSNKNVTGHVTYLQSSMWGGVSSSLYNKIYLNKLYEVQFVNEMSKTSLLFSKYQSPPLQCSR